MRYLNPIRGTGHDGEVRGSDGLTESGGLEDRLSLSAGTGCVVIKAERLYSGSSYVDRRGLRNQG